MDDDLTPEEALALKHKQEKRDLQATIQGLKKTATKGDKKKKKDVQDQIIKLESSLAEKHQAELKALNDVETNVEKLEELSVNDETDANEKASKLTKAQKRRNKKDNENRQREKRIAEQEVENETGLRNVETNNIKGKLKEKNLMIHEIPSDGDCLYKAVDHNLLNVGISEGVTSLRNKVSHYMLAHPQEYIPFIVDPKVESNAYENLKNYCDNVKNTKQWGGHVELDALSHIFKKTLIIVQDGSELVIGEQYLNNGTFTLSYHRHMYSLGQHYNSVRTYEAEEEI